MLTRFYLIIENLFFNMITHIVTKKEPHIVRFQFNYLRNSISSEIMLMNSSLVTVILS